MRSLNGKSVSGLITVKGSHLVGRARENAAVRRRGLRAKEAI